jgi:hypothetical protein
MVEAKDYGEDDFLRAELGPAGRITRVYPAFPGSPGSPVCTDILLVRRELLLDTLSDLRGVEAGGIARSLVPLWAKGATVTGWREKNTIESLPWHSLRTIDDYYEANMDQVDIAPPVNTYAMDWTLAPRSHRLPGARFVFAQEGRRMGLAVDSIVGEGTIISGARVLHSVLSRQVRVNSYSEVEYSLVGEDSQIGRYSRIRRCIVDQGARLPDSSVVGFDLERDRASGYYVTNGGLTVITCLPASAQQTKSVLPRTEERTEEQPAEDLRLFERFMQHAGATAHSFGRKTGEISEATGMLKPYLPVPILLAESAPTEADVVELSTPASGPGSAGILLYRDTPSPLVRLRITEARLKYDFRIVPIPLTNVLDWLRSPPACIGILQEYLGRYLGKTDLFADSNAISDAISFFGRSSELATLQTELRNHQSVGLFGLRKAGKTSILFQLELALRQNPVIKIDLQMFDSRSEYCERLFSRIVVGLEQLAARSTDPVGVRFGDDPGMDAERFAERVLRVAPDLERAGFRMPIVLLLDEVERVLPSPSDPAEVARRFNRLFGALRVLCQQHRVLSLVATDVQPACNRTNYWVQPGATTNPVWNFFKELYLGPFSRDETVVMIDMIGSFMGRRLNSAIGERIHAYGGGQPYVSRLLASLVCKRIPEEEPPDGKVKDVLRDALKHSSALRNYLDMSVWRPMRRLPTSAATELVRKLAKAGGRMAAGEAIQSLKGFSLGDALDAVQWLEDVGLVATSAERENEYLSIEAPVLRDWVLNMTGGDL